MDFTYKAINLDITQDDKLQMCKEIMSIPEKFYHWNNFRNCAMIPMYNGGGKIGIDAIQSDTKQGLFQYTEAGKYCNSIIKICEEKIFPFMRTPGRVTVLRTYSNQGLNIHLDSKESEVGTLQHKFRLVLKGNVSKLYFLDRHCLKIYIPPSYDSYIIDGSHPHGLDPDPIEKITICIGAPWHGEFTDEYQKILDNSICDMKISRPETKKEWLEKNKR